MFSRDMQTEIFAEGIWDKRVQTEIAAALVRALKYGRQWFGSNVVDILTGVISQGALVCFHEIFMSKYGQRPRGTRNLTLRSLPHLDMD